MKKVEFKKVIDFVDKNMMLFYSTLEDEVRKIDFFENLLSINPYLLGIRNINTTGDFFEYILNSHLSILENTLLDDFLKRIAVFVCENTYKIKMKSVRGIDLELRKDNNTYLVSIISNANIDNSIRIKEIRKSFKEETKRLIGSTRNGNIKCIIGFCYGRIKWASKSDFIEVAGQEFWEFISGDSELYTKVFLLLKQKANEKNKNFINEYNRKLNLLVLPFADEFCVKGKIDWEKLVRYNSQNEKMKIKLSLKNKY
ncbi:MAG: PmeII family type II restriction endonuclease [bacterium]